MTKNQVVAPYLEAATEKGDSDAQNRWLTEAAEQGSEQAQMLLDELFEDE